MKQIGSARSAKSMQINKKIYFQFIYHFLSLGRNKVSFSYHQFEVYVGQKPPSVSYVLHQNH